jgi:predicted RNA-binding protein with PUA-like domain
MAETIGHWLMKSEPESYSIHDLAAEPTRTTYWSGVRNYQARNFMRSMRVGDRVLFYHSNADPPAVAGTAIVVRTAYPDFTALDPDDDHYDPKSTRENPIWEMVDIRFERAFPRPVPLDVLRGTPGLKDIELLRHGSRLSVQPVSAEHFEIVLKLADRTLTKSPATSSKQKKAAARSTGARKRAKRKT